MSDTLFLFEEIKREPMKYAGRFPYTVGALIAQKKHETQAREIYEEHLRKLITTPNDQNQGRR